MDYRWITSYVGGRRMLGGYYAADAIALFGLRRKLVTDETSEDIRHVRSSLVLAHIQYYSAW